MDRKRFEKIRILLNIAGALILVVATALLVRTGLSFDTGTKDRPEVPSTTQHLVLFISSYSPRYFTYNAQASGIEKGLYPNQVDYDAFYMDSRNYPGEEDEEEFYDFLRSRLSQGNRKYDAVLAGDDDALQLVMKYRDILFPDLPVVFFGINNLDLAMSAGAVPDITGFYETDYLMETLNLAIKLFPDRKRIVALHDRSSAGESDMKVFYDCAMGYPDHVFTDVNTGSMSRSGFIDTLNSLPDDSIIIYMTCYSDSEGNTYSVENMTKTIVDNTDCPIFRNYEGTGEDGTMGGVYLDMEEHARLAAVRVCEILHGTNVFTYSTALYTPSRCAFDYELLRRYGLGVTALPENTIIYNKPESFMEHYGRVFTPVVMILLGMLLFMGSTYIGVVMGRKDNEELRLSRDRVELSKEELRYQAEHDDLLGIYNRRTITEKLRNETTTDTVYSIVMADLDGFKEINEGYGHQVSDEILKYISSLLNEMALENDWMLARYGGDEFIFMIPGEKLTMEHPITNMLLEAFRTSVPLGDIDISMSASLGISCSDGIASSDEHIINAELAMYEAKARGRNGAFIYDMEMKEKAREESRMKELLLEAFDSNGFYMVYQPQVNTETQEVTGYEALVRMRAPGMYPGKFIPIAEANGWIWRIGRITTKLVVEQLATWKEKGYELHPVSINFSSNQINDTGYQRFLEDLLEKYDIPPEYVEIEITEGVFLDRSDMADKLFARFGELGIKLLMDDFGTGYSSLGYLTYIPVDVIKLDKSLVDAYLVDGKDSFIKDVIQLVHDLDKKMIVEGVEEKRQYEKLREFGADMIQGYYFSKPLPADEAIVFNVKEKD